MWLLVVVVFSLTLVAKAIYGGWMDAREAPDLSGRAGLVFFTLSNGCECQMVVVRAAEAQLAKWQPGLPVLRMDFDRNRHLAATWDIARAPALVLVDAEGQMVWAQGEGVRDELPLDLDQVELQIQRLAEWAIP